MKEKANHYANIAMVHRNEPNDPKSNPANFNGSWTWWYDELGIEDD